MIGDFLTRHSREPFDDEAAKSAQASREQLDVLASRGHRSSAQFFQRTADGWATLDFDPFELRRTALSIRNLLDVPSDVTKH